MLVVVWKMDSAPGECWEGGSRQGQGDKLGGSHLSHIWRVCLLGANFCHVIKDSRVVSRAGDANPVRAGVQRLLKMPKADSVPAFPQDVKADGCLPSEGI